MLVLVLVLVIIIIYPTNIIHNLHARLFIIGTVIFIIQDERNLMLRTFPRFNMRKKEKCLNKIIIIENYLEVKIFVYLRIFTKFQRVNIFKSNVNLYNPLNFFALIRFFYRHLYILIHYSTL